MITFGEMNSNTLQVIKKRMILAILAFPEKI